MSTTFNIAAAVVFALTAVATAEDNRPIELPWDTLAPAGSDQYRDPFAQLTRQQLDSLGFVVRIQRLIAAEKIQPDGDSAAEAAKIAKQLKKDGIDIPWLMSQRERVKGLREKQAQTLTKSIAKQLDGKRVRLTGYVIPLKISQGRVTEFCLVSSLAACSHASIPPANQAVYVTSDAGIVITGRQASVSVVGNVMAKKTTRFILSATGPKKATAAYTIVPQSIETHAPRETE